MVDRSISRTDKADVSRCGVDEMEKTKFSNCFLVAALAFSFEARAGGMEPGTILIGKYNRWGPVSMEVKGGRQVEYCYWENSGEFWYCFDAPYKKTDGKMVVKLSKTGTLTITDQNAVYGFSLVVKREGKPDDKLTARMAKIYSSWPEPRYHSACVQKQLAVLGFDPGKPDSKIGPATRRALDAYSATQPDKEQPEQLSPETAKMWCEELAKRSGKTRLVMERQRIALDWSEKQRDIVEKLQNAKFEGLWNGAHQYNLHFGKGQPVVPVTVRVIDSDPKKTKYNMPARASVVGDRVSLRFTRFDRHDVLTYDRESDVVHGTTIYRGQRSNRLKAVKN